MVSCQLLGVNPLFLLSTWVRSQVPATASSSGLSCQGRVSLIHGQSVAISLACRSTCQCACPARNTPDSPKARSCNVCAHLTLPQPSPSVPLLWHHSARPGATNAPEGGASANVGRISGTATYGDCHRGDHCGTDHWWSGTAKA